MKKTVLLTLERENCKENTMILTLDRFGAVRFDGLKNSRLFGETNQEYLIEISGREYSADKIDILFENAEAENWFFDMANEGISLLIDREFPFETGLDDYYRVLAIINEDGTRFDIPKMLLDDIFAALSR